MIESRQVVARKDQLLVAIPASIRDHLGVRGAVTVWWHTVVGGEALLTRTPTRKGGRPRVSADCPNCKRYLQDIARLRGRVAMKPVVDYNTAFGQGFQKGVALGPIWRHALDDLRTDNEALRREISELRAVVRERLPRRRADPGHPSPPPPPPASEVEGGADTSGAQPPGVPVEDESRTDRARGEPGV